MRWPVIDIPERPTGTMRIKRRFLLFPKCMQNEWRWLEWASWYQVWEVKWYDSDDGYCAYGWKNVRWLGL